MHETNPKFVFDVSGAIIIILSIVILVIIITIYCFASYKRFPEISSDQIPSEFEEQCSVKGTSFTLTLLETMRPMAKEFGDLMKMISTARHMMNDIFGNEQSR